MVPDQQRTAYALRSIRDKTLILRDASLRDAPQSLTENAASILRPFPSAWNVSLFRHGRA
jgi:hypothetical protein